MEGGIRQTPAALRPQPGADLKDICSLVRQAADPDTEPAERLEAFSQIVRRLQDMVYGCAYAILGDFHLAEDAAQESFLAAWRKLSQLRRPEAFPGWLHRIVVRQCGRMTRGAPPPGLPLEATGDQTLAKSPGKSDLADSVIAKIRADKGPIAAVKAGRLKGLLQSSFNSIEFRDICRQPLTIKIYT